MKKNKTVNISNHSLLKKILKWFVIPIILLASWLFFSLTVGSYKSLTVLSYGHLFQNLNNSNDFKITNGTSIKGVFKANDDYLGIIEIPLGKVPKVKSGKEEIITFKIKEFNKNEWLYENNYKSKLFKSNKYFPFGFIQITDSKNKTYEFEISSLNSDKENAIEIDKNNAKFYSKYKFPINYIFNNFESLSNFIIQKLITFFNNSNLLIASLSFLYPLLFYLLYVSLNYKFWDKKIYKMNLKQLFAIIVLTLILIINLFYANQTTGNILGLLGLWVAAIYMNKLSSTYTYILAFLLIVLSVIGIYFSSELLVNEISSFSYFLVVLGLFQSVFEIKQKNSKN